MTVRVLHVSEEHSMGNPGVTHAIETIASSAGEALGHEAAMGILAAGVPDRTPPSGVRLMTLPMTVPAWRWALGQKRAIEQAIADFAPDVVHIHALWMAPQALALAAAQRRGIASLVSAHGGLTRYALSQPGRLGALKKRAYLALVAARRVGRASVLHAITAEERDQLARLFAGRRIVTLPNAVDVASIAAAAGEAAPAEDILFLGRLHPLKGIDLLLGAFARAPAASRFRLVIAGPRQDAAYASALERLAASLGIADRVRFPGAVRGPARFALMRRAWVVALPSHSEVMSLVNLEAAACATPSITTTATGLEDWEQGGGLLVPPGDVDALAAALDRACRWSAEERAERGRASRALVAERYATSVVAPRWAALYRELAQR